MTLQRIEHVGIVVDDLTAAIEFFAELGFELQGTMAVEGRWVDRIIGLEGVRNGLAMMQTPDGHGRLELIEFHSPSYEGDNRHEPANAPGIRHIAFVVEDIDAVVARLRARGAELVGELENYKNSYRLCSSAARRESSSSWPSRSADGSGSAAIALTAGLPWGHDLFPPRSHGCSHPRTGEARDRAENPDLKVRRRR
jgi:catechol 2,3-dioxygenase-like lactoylglutathione lyase family enzyme